MAENNLVMNRRAALGLLGAVAIPSAGIVAATVGSVAQAETPAQKVNRLAEELSVALNDYAGGKFHAEVLPSNSTEWPICFRVTDLRLSPMLALEAQVAHTKAALKKVYPDKLVRADILPYAKGRECNVLIMTHDGEL